MAGWVEEDAECGAGLVLGAGRAECEHRPFASVEVVDHDVDVHLLGEVLALPLRPPELLDLLEADALIACRVANLAPTVV